MLKITAAILLVSVVYYTECHPTAVKSEAETKSANKLQLYVNHGQNGVNYHLRPVIDELVTEDEKVNVDFNALLPYLNFLLGAGASEGEEAYECLDQMEIQLVKED